MNRDDTAQHESPTPMPDLDLAELRRLHESATAAPWTRSDRQHPSPSGMRLVAHTGPSWSNEGADILCPVPSADASGHGRHARDATLIVALRNNAASLLAAAEEGQRAKARIAALENLIAHCWVHSGYEDCGRRQMDSAQQALYDEVIAKESARDD